MTVKEINKELKVAMEHVGGSQGVEGTIFFCGGEKGLGYSMGGMWDDSRILNAIITLRDNMNQRELVDIYLNGDEVNF